MTNMEPDNNKSHFLQVLDRVCLLTRLQKQDEMATFLGVSRSTFSRKRIQGDFPPEWAFKIAHKFNFSTDWLLTGQRPPECFSDPASPVPADFSSDLSAMEQGKIKQFAKEIRNMLDKQERQIHQARNLLERIVWIAEGDRLP